MGFFSGLKRLFGKKEESVLPLSMVLLLRQKRTLNQAELQRMASQAVGFELEMNQMPTPPFFGDGSQVFAAVGQNPEGKVFPLLISNVHRPYFDDPQDVAENILELRVRQAILDNVAWISVDLPRDKRHWDDHAEAYRWIGKVIAALADDDCMAIFSPDGNQLNAYDPSLLDQLRGENPLAIFGRLSNAPVIGVEEGDAAMKAAVEEARRRWPEFVAAFTQRRDDQQFSAKGPFREGDNSEFMWIMVTAIEGEEIVGELGNDPVNLKKLKIGDPVRMKLVDLNDWIIVGGDEMTGGFTIKVLQQRENQ